MQSAVNSQLRQVLGSPFQAGFVSFAVGATALGAYVISHRMEWPIRDAASSPWWVWTGGLLGAYLVTSNVVVAPRIGATALIALVITGQLASALVLDHYGLLGFQANPVQWERLLGVGLVIGGAILVRQF